MAIALVLYVGSYAYLSRYQEREMSGGLLRWYLPVRWHGPDQNLTRAGEFILHFVYFPLNVIDHAVTGIETHTPQDPCWGISD